MDRLTQTVRRFQVPLVLGWITLVHLVAVLGWLRLDTLDVYWVPDDFAHVTGLFQLITSLELGGLGAALSYLLEINSHYPFLAHYPLALAALIFGSPEVSARAANVVYFVALLVSVYGIGRRCHGRQAGLLAAALVSLMPAVYGGWRTIGLDYPSLCATPLAIWALLSCRDFSDRRASLAFGLAAGLATLLKAQSLFFIAGPAAFVIGRAALAGYRGDRAHLRELAVGVALAAAAFTALTAIWWGGRIGYFMEQLHSHATGEGMHHYEGDISLWGGVKYYAASFSYLVPGVAIIAAAALTPLFLKHSRHRAVVLLWFFFPLVVHIVFKLRHYRYLFPLVPALALVLAVGVVSLKPRWRGSAAGALTIVLLFFFVVCPFNGEICRQVTVEALSPYYEAVDRKQKPVAAYLFGCGDAMFTAPRCAPFVQEGDSQNGAQIARWIVRKQPAGATAILYYGVIDTNVALAVRRRLPNLRLSEYVFGDYAHHQPPASWHRYALYEFDGEPPAFTRRLRSSELLLLKKAAAADHRAEESRLVLWKLRPNEVWPKPTRDGLARYLEDVR